MDRALRGRGLLGVGKAKRPKTKGPSPSMTRRPREERDSLEDLGTYVSGGIEGKPHSTKEGRIASGKRHIGRFFSQFKKKKGTPV